MDMQEYRASLMKKNQASLQKQEQPSNETENSMAHFDEVLLYNFILLSSFWLTNFLNRDRLWSVKLLMTYTRNFPSKNCWKMWYLYY